MKPGKSRLSAGPAGKGWNVARHTRDNDLMLVTKKAGEFPAALFHAADACQPRNSSPNVGRAPQPRLFRAALETNSPWLGEPLNRVL
jgi:hypothetical protein